MAGPENGPLDSETVGRLLKTFRWELCILERTALTGFPDLRAIAVPKKIIGTCTFFRARSAN